MKKRTYRLFLSLMLLISTLTIGIMPVSATGNTFNDVPDDVYYAKPVAWAVDKGITKGMSDTMFCPEEGCTRSQVVTFLYRYAGSPDVNAGSASRFEDVSSGEYYSSAVAWAVENNITAGTSDTTFSPSTKCTRAQIVTFLWRYKNEVKASKASSFQDVKNGSYYADAVSWAVEQSITKGTSDTTFSPENTCTRAQIVTFLFRMDQASAGISDPDTDPGTTPGGDSTGTDGLGSVDIGDYVTFGHYEQDNNNENGKESIEWKVLDKKDGRVLLLSKYGLDAKPYNETQTNVTWETCTLRSWLNGDFLNEAFSTSEKSAIPMVTLSNPDNPNVGTEGGNATQDQVFLLSLQEMQHYFNLTSTWMDYDGHFNDVTGDDGCVGGSKDVITSATVYAEGRGAATSSYNHDVDGKESCWWWLRSPGFNSLCATYVDFDGSVRTGLYVNCDGDAVRPALWVNLPS